MRSSDVVSAIILEDAAAGAQNFHFMHHPPIASHSSPCFPAYPNRFKDSTGGGDVTIGDSAGLDVVAGHLQGTGGGTGAVPSATVSTDWLPGPQSEAYFFTSQIEQPSSLCYQPSELGLEGNVVSSTPET